MKSHQNTALLVFIRSEQEELDAKSFGKSLSKKEQQSIIRQLNTHAKKVAQQSNLPFFVISGKKQTGDNFGERLSDSIQQVFNKGFENVITIGNDCLAITPETLRSSANLLQDQAIILSPTVDGGVYLLGINKRVFNKEVFQTLSWQSPLLFNDLLAYADKYGIAPLSFGAIKIDADDGFSLKSNLHYLNPNTRLKNILQNLIKDPQKRLEEIKHLFQPITLFLQNPLRGPPSNLSISNYHIF